MKILILIVLCLVMQSCVTVKEYDKQNINDPNMKLSANTTERYETAFQIYREGASGANGGKTGGGCGCN